MRASGRGPVIWPQPMAPQTQCPCGHSGLSPTGLGHHFQGEPSVPPRVTSKPRADQQRLQVLTTAGGPEEVRRKGQSSLLPAKAVLLTDQGGRAVSAALPSQQCQLTEGSQPGAV